MMIDLITTFVQVYAYDYSEGFVENMLARAKEAGVTNLSGRQGDAHCQQEQYPDLKFDLITGCNLIDRLHTPKLWVQQSRVIFDILIVFTIYTEYDYYPLIAFNLSCAGDVV